MLSRLFGNAVHAGFVVPDMDEAVERLLASGAGPAFVIRKVRSPARYRGVRQDLLMSAAFVNSGSMQYEFVEQHDHTPSAYRDFVLKHPTGGLHHLAYYCDSFEHALQHAAKLGTPLSIVQEFITADGVPYEIYVEPMGSADPLLIQLMTRGPLTSLFDQMEHIAKDWDGSDPIRNALDLLSPDMRPPSDR